jgi:hypothetical protein
MDEEIKKSKFNAGVAHAERIDALQRAINKAKYNPLQHNPETGTFNYHIMMVSADNLVSEGWDKFSDEEKEQTKIINNQLKKLEKFYPPITLGRNEQTKVNFKNYDEFLKLFEILERRLKELYGKHHLNAPTYDEDDGDYDY